MRTWAVIDLALTVAPYTGAWIEISAGASTSGSPIWSLPTRERGLKSIATTAAPNATVVAPYTGAWIEIFGQALCRSDRYGRSLHGSVD